MNLKEKWDLTETDRDVVGNEKKTLGEQKANIFLDKEGSERESEDSPS